MSIAISKTQIAAAVAGLALAFSFAVATPASAQSAEDLQAQISSLLATIASLQAQLSGMNGGSTTGGTGTTCTGYTFTGSYDLGDSAPEVMEIQKFLNANGAVIAASGAGSPGNETSYFGGLTKAAAKKFQEMHASDILAPVGLTSGTGYWGPSTRAKANMLSQSCTSTGTGTGTGTGTVTPTGAGVTVAATTQPANAIAPKAASRVPFTRFTLTAGASPVEITGVRVQRTGPSDNSVFAGVVLLDENGIQLGTDRSLNSNDQATVGTRVTIPAGATRTFTVAGNIDATTTRGGEVASLAVIAVNTTAVVNGSLPISGAQHVINDTLSIATVTVDEGSSHPSASTEEVGNTGVVFASLEVDNNSSEEDVRVMSVRFENTGSASGSDLKNVVIRVNGTDYPVTVSEDGRYFTATFGAGILLREGNDEDFEIRGDIDNTSSAAGRTVIMGLDELTDVHVVGQTFGYGITPTGTFTAVTISIQAGELQSVSRNNAIAAGNVTVERNDENLGGFTVNFEGEGARADNITFNVTITNAGGTKTPTVTGLTNVTLVDDNGVVLAGPEDGAGAALTGTIKFSTVEFPVGETNLTLKGKLDNNFEQDDTITISTTVTNTSSTWDDLRGVNTNDTITLPGGTVTAHVQTVRAASLTARNLATPAVENIVAGITDYIFATAVLDATESGEDIEVKDVTFAVVLGGAASIANMDNLEVWSLDSNGNLKSKLSDTENPSSGTTVNFDIDPNIDILRGGTMEIALVGDMNSAAATNDVVTWDLSAVNAEGKESNVDTDVSSVGGTNGQAQTVAGNGVLSVKEDSTSPEAMLLIEGVNGVHVASFEFSASDVEDITLEELTLGNTGSTSAVATYEVYQGSTLLGSNSGSGVASSTITLNGNAGVTVPKDKDIVLDVKVRVANVDGTTVANGAAVAVELNGYEAQGTQSGNSMDVTTGAPTTTVSHTVYEAYPQVSFKTGGTGNINQSGEELIDTLVITNAGTEDVTFENADGNLIVFTVNSSGTVGNFIFKDKSGQTLQSGVALANGAATTTFATKELTVPAGGSEEIQIYADTTAMGTGGNSIQVQITDIAGAIVFGIDGTGAFAEGNNILQTGNITSRSLTKPN